MNESGKTITVDLGAVYHACAEIDDILVYMQQARAASNIILEQLEDEYTIPSKPNYNQRIEELTDALELVANRYFDLEKMLREQNEAIFNAIRAKEATE